MPWEEKERKDMRKEFCERVLAHEKTKSALCQEYGISRPTGDKWLKRYLAGEKLEDRSRAPDTVANRLDPAKEACIVAYRKKYPSIGALKLRDMMLEEDEKNNPYGTDLPSAKTFNNVFRRNGLITEEASRAATPYKRFEKAEPNEMWQADYKGHFAYSKGGRCHPLNILDDCTRYCLCCEPLNTETFSEAKPHLERIFRENGLPRTFLCDNGNPWGSSQAEGYTLFEVWMMELGILVLHGRPLHPQTQGKEERFNSSLKKECLRYVTIADQADAAIKLGEYRQFYNCKRPHHALGLDRPARRYHRSEREFPEEIKPWEYTADCDTRRVKHTGQIAIGGLRYYLSAAFAGKTVAIREANRADNLIEVLFRGFQIGVIDRDKRCFIQKRAYLLRDDPRLSVHSEASQNDNF